MSSIAVPGAARVVRAGLIGAGIQASLTPALHMREGAEQGLAYTYDLFDLDVLPAEKTNLRQLLRSAQDEGLVGVNVTYPCKQSIIAELDELSDDATALRAVNTVVFRDGRKIGHNTDWWGFAESFRRGLPDVKLDQVVQLGAGGAGAAVGYAMLKLGAQSLSILDVDQMRMEDLVRTLQQLFPGRKVSAIDDITSAMAHADGLVQATPIGMKKAPGMPLPPNLLSAKHWFVEIIYFPLETELLKNARRASCRTLDGGGMAIYQAVRAFELFTGLKPDPERMARHFDELARRPLTSLTAE